MKLAGKLSVTGELKIFKSKGRMPDVEKDMPLLTTNLVVQTGATWVAQRMAGSTSPAPKDMNYMALGDGTTAVVSTDETLVNELGRTDGVTNQVADSRVTYIGTLKEGEATGAITEAGIFDSPLVGNDGGIMLARSVFPVVNKQADDYITILWVITVGTCV